MRQDGEPSRSTESLGNILSVGAYRYANGALVRDKDPNAFASSFGWLYLVP